MQKIKEKPIKNSGQGPVKESGWENKITKNDGSFKTQKMFSIQYDFMFCREISVFGHNLGMWREQSPSSLLPLFVFVFKKEE